jgi:hypothetical protein
MRMYATRSYRYSFARGSEVVTPAEVGMQRLRESLAADGLAMAGPIKVTQVEPNEHENADEPVFEYTVEVTPRGAES